MMGVMTGSHATTYPVQYSGQVLSEILLPPPCGARLFRPNRCLCAPSKIAIFTARRGLSSCARSTCAAGDGTLGWRREPSTVVNVMQTNAAPPLTPQQMRARLVAAHEAAQKFLHEG